MWKPEPKQELANPYSEDERLQVMLACAYKGVQSGFAHLPIRYIVNPPHHLFDAALARQIAMHIMHYQFDVPRRRIVALQQRQRSAVLCAIRTVNMRLNEPVFTKAYHEWAALAKDLFFDEIRKAAA